MLVTDLKNDRDTRMIDKRLETFLNHLLAVFTRRGTSVVPCHFDGILFDLLENLQLFLAAINHAPIPIYFVATEPLDAEPCAPQWLCQSKMQKLFAGASPFVHGQLRDEGHLRFVSPGSPVPVEEPCIVFANHPSLRIGDVVQLIPKLQRNAANAIVFIDPYVSPFEAMTPFQPTVLMEVIHAPIDFRLSCNNANILIAECKPQTLVLPACYASYDLILAAQVNLTTIDKHAAALVRTTLSFASGRVELKAVDGDFWAFRRPPPPPPAAAGALDPSSHSSLEHADGAPCKKLCVREQSHVLLGELDLESLLHQLQVEFGPVHIEDLDMATQVSFGDTVITFVTNENKTVVASGSDRVRDRVAHLVVGQLSRF
ncbi:hypothetical protein DYB38_000847 [Aphanomyces astaci]|uniref:Beta-Casp domain-containing protein n=1 Tax=Aphanomyces astaci TaxID=112090 RepID=A0A397DBW3_APHAT|nr:hypothetical protein DYB38_000847 [Aphanomyces astaci]